MLSELFCLYYFFVVINYSFIAMVCFMLFAKRHTDLVASKVRKYCAVLLPDYRDFRQMYKHVNYWIQNTR